MKTKKLKIRNSTAEFLIFTKQDGIRNCSEIPNSSVFSMSEFPTYSSTPTSVKNIKSYVQLGIKNEQNQQ